MTMTTAWSRRTDRQEDRPGLAPTHPRPERPPQVSVVLPCLNEAGSVAAVVRQARAAFAASAIDGEVIVADNGSSDGSPELARAAGARVVDVPDRGYGAALHGGIAAARGEICVMGDADATYPFELLGQLVDPIARNEADMVIGSRLAGATAQTMPFLHRYLGTPVITWLVRRAGGPAGVTDSQSGFRAFRRQALLDLDLRSTGMEYASEMLVLAGRAGWRVADVATGYRERIGESKLDTFSDGLRHLTTIMLLAPDLAATIPGLAAVSGGVLALIWALFDPAIRQPGSIGWLASFLAPTLLVLGSQAIMIGLLFSRRSPIAAGRTAQSHRMPLQFLVGGIWALGAGVILVAALAIVRTLGYPAPFRGAQIEMLALVLILLGGSAIASSLMARLVDEGLQRYSPGIQPERASVGDRVGRTERRAGDRRVASRDQDALLAGRVERTSG